MRCDSFGVPEVVMPEPAATKRTPTLVERFFKIN